MEARVQVCLKLDFVRPAASILTGDPEEAREVEAILATGVALLKQHLHVPPTPPQYVQLDPLTQEPLAMLLHEVIYDALLHHVPLAQGLPMLKT
eukprot:scaffold4778_cov142-Isochrysis_galbana.AAC.2